MLRDDFEVGDSLAITLTESRHLAGGLDDDKL